MKRFITFFLLAVVCFLRVIAGTDIVYMNVGDVKTLSFNAPPYIEGTQWTISDDDALTFTTSPGSLDTKATVKALSPRTAANRCIVHCTYYYRELDPVTGRYIYQRTGYQDWEVIIRSSGGGGGGGSSDDNTSVSMRLTSINLSIGESINVIAYPSSSSYSGSYSWETSNSNILSVYNQRGNMTSIKGVSGGKAYLRVTIDNGRFQEIPVNVSDPVRGDFVYTLTDDGKGYAIGWNKDKTCSGHKKIPSSYKGKPVTEISDEGFRSCDKLTSVEIPNSITSIGFAAFLGCNSLSSIKIPNSVTQIGINAFSDCSSLKIVEIPRSVSTIYIWAFEGSDNIRTVKYDAPIPIRANRNIFSDQVYQNATLEVAKGALFRAKTVDPWMNFVKIKEVDFSGIDEVVVDELDPDAPAEVYDLSGVRVADSIDSLPAGLYIVRQGGIVKKVVVK